MVASSAQVIDSHNLSSEIALIRDVEMVKASYPIDWVAIRLDRKCRGLSFHCRGSSAGCLSQIRLPGKLAGSLRAAGRSQIFSEGWVTDFAA
jgi:hypothetical protein